MALLKKWEVHCTPTSNKANVEDDDKPWEFTFFFLDVQLDQHGLSPN
jgi:hypothetical protein